MSGRSRHGARTPIARWTTAWLLGTALAAGAAPAQPPAGGAQMTHTIQRGETIWSLSRRYGVSVEAIVEANRIRDVRRVRAGRALRIPLAERFETPMAPDREALAEGKPAASAAQEAPGREPPEPALAVAEVLARAEDALRSARFEEALAVVVEACRVLDAGEGDVDASRAERARLEVIAGSAEVALTRYGDALASFGRALEADPGLRLDPATTSPKVVRVFDEARARAAAESAPVSGSPE